jgi:hypothetical protein
MEEELNEAVKQSKFKTWTAFETHIKGKYQKNFKYTILGNLEKINGWLGEIGLEIKIVKKDEF